MTFRKHVGQFLVLLMLATQLLLAQHATVHFLEGAHVALQPLSAGPAKDHGEPDKDKACQICIFSKGLSHALLHAGADVPVAQTASGFILPHSQPLPARPEAGSYEARGPPAFSA